MEVIKLWRPLPPQRCGTGVSLTTPWGFHRTRFRRMSWLGSWKKDSKMAVFFFLLRRCRMAQGVRTIFSIAFGRKGSKRELDNHGFERNFLNFHVLAMHKTSSRRPCFQMLRQEMGERVLLRAKTEVPSWIHDRELFRNPTSLGKGLGTLEMNFQILETMVRSSLFNLKPMKFRFRDRSLFWKIKVQSVPKPWNLDSIPNHEILKQIWNTHRWRKILTSKTYRNGHLLLLF